MAVSLVSTGVQFPDATIQTTAAGASGVTSVGSVVRTSGSQFYLATPANQLVNGGYVPSIPSRFSGTSPVPLARPRYSTHYGMWITHDTNVQTCYVSRDGISWTQTFNNPDDFSSDTPRDGASMYVVDDSNGRIFCFASDNVNTTLGYWYKDDFSASWSAFISLLGSTTNRNYWSVEFVWFGTAGTSGIAIAFSNSTDSYVAVIPAGTTSSVGKINSSNSNGQAMSMDWNQAGGTVVVMSRSAGSTSQLSVMFQAGSNVNGTWTGVTRATCGFDPGNGAAEAKPVVGASGSVIYSSQFSSGNYRYAPAGSLNAAWTQTSVGSQQILYYGYTGTTWYMAKGQQGTLSSNTGFFNGFFTSTSATPSTMSSSTQVPLLPTDSALTVTYSGLWTQRKY